MLIPDYVPKFIRDVKKLRRKKYDIDKLFEVIRLVCNNDNESIKILKQHHNMHTLKGNRSGLQECHVANAGDWLIVWETKGEIVHFLRTGSHDELFK